MFSSAGRDMTSAKRSFRIPFAALMSRRTRPIRKTRTTRRRVGVTMTADRISSSTIPDKQQQDVLRIELNVPISFTVHPLQPSCDHYYLGLNISEKDRWGTNTDFPYKIGYRIIFVIFKVSLRSSC